MQKLCVIQTTLVETKIFFVDPSTSDLSLVPLRQGADASFLRDRDEKYHLHEIGEYLSHSIDRSEFFQVSILSSENSQKAMARELQRRAIPFQFYEPLIADLPLKEDTTKLDLIS